MKKLFTLFLVMISLSLFAQRHYVIGPALTANPAGSRSLDTIPWMGGVPAFYASPGGGYACGSDGYGALQVAQMFNNTRTIKVLGALCWFGGKIYTSNDTNSKVAFKLYKTDRNYVNHSSFWAPGPGTVLSQVSMPLANINAGLSFATGGNGIHFPAPVTVDSGYALGFDVSQLGVGDSIGIVSNTTGNGGGREMSVEQWWDSSWHSFMDTLNWGLDVDLFIWPIVDATQFSTVNAIYCQGSTYDFNGTVLNSAGTYTDTIHAGGYDSIVTLNLSTVLPDTVHVYDSICKGDFFFFNGQNLDTAGIYIAHQTDRNGCDSMIVLHLAVQTIDTSVQVYVNMLAANQSNAMYQWIDCGTSGAINGATAQTFTPTQTGSYKVMITMGNCIAVSPCYTVALSGINEHERLHFSIQPNPTKDVCTLYLNGTRKRSGAIYNITGEKVLQLFTDENAYRYSFNTGLLPSGIYLVKVSDADGRTGIETLVVE